MRDRPTRMQWAATLIMHFAASHCGQSDLFLSWSAFLLKAASMLPSGGELTGSALEPKLTLIHRPPDAPNGRVLLNEDDLLLRLEGFPRVRSAAGPDGNNRV